MRRMLVVVVWAMLFVSAVDAWAQEAAQGSERIVVQVANEDGSAPKGASDALRRYAYLVSHMALVVVHLASPESSVDTTNR
jgi:hypothetical protein